MRLLGGIFAFALVAVIADASSAAVVNVSSGWCVENPVGLGMLEQRQTCDGMFGRAGQFYQSAKVYSGSGAGVSEASRMDGSQLGVFKEKSGSLAGSVESLIGSQGRYSDVAGDVGRTVFNSRRVVGNARELEGWSTLLAANSKRLPIDNNTGTVMRRVEAIHMVPYAGPNAVPRTAMRFESGRYDISELSFAGYRDTRDTGNALLSGQSAKRPIFSAVVSPVAGQWLVSELSSNADSTIRAATGDEPFGTRVIADARLNTLSRGASMANLAPILSGYVRNLIAPIQMSRGDLAESVLNKKQEFDVVETGRAGKLSMNSNDRPKNGQELVQAVGMLRLRAQSSVNAGVSIEN